MATTWAQILTRLDAVLKAAAPVGTTVYRGRSEAESLAEARAINVKTGRGTVEAFSDDFDRNEEIAELHLYVRDDDPILAAEALHEAVHPAITTDAALLALAESVRRVEASGDPQEADTSALVKVVGYRFVFLTPRNSL